MKAWSRSTVEGFARAGESTWIPWKWHYAGLGYIRSGKTYTVPLKSLAEGLSENRAVLERFGAIIW